MHQTMSNAELEDKLMDCANRMAKCRQHARECRKKRHADGDYEEKRNPIQVESKPTAAVDL